MGSIEGCPNGIDVGSEVGCADGLVGTDVGHPVGLVGAEVGFPLGCPDGVIVGMPLGSNVG